MHQEILLTLVFLLIAALLFGGVLFLRYAEQGLLDSHLRQLVQGTESVARNVSHDESMRLSPSSLQQLQAEPAAEAWWYFDLQLQLRDSRANAQPSQVFSTTRLRGMFSQRDSLLDVSWPGLLGLFGRTDEKFSASVATLTGPPSNPLGILVVRYSLDRVRDQLLLAQRLVFLYALGYGLILAAAGFLLLRRNVIQPVKNLLRATEKVTGGNLDASLEVSGPAEIADLAESFNGMTTALRFSRQQTEAHIQSLHETNAVLKNTQQQLIRSEKLATVGHLAAGMAHEIGNPLGALIGYLALLREELSEGSHQELATHAAGEAERIDRLVRDLLDYAAPGQPDPEPVAPWPVVLDTLVMLDAQGALKGVQLDAVVTGELPRVTIDRHKLSQILVNLLLNARDACAMHGLIRISGGLEGDRVVLAVTDDGQGMTPEVQRKLFEPFFTTKDPGRGRGLGLAVCQRVMSDAGGEIRVVSNPGYGSCITLVLPQAGVTDD